MQPIDPNPYLKTKIMTAGSEELRLMLYDGALKFCCQARIALDNGKDEECFNGLMRAQKIVLELSTSLNCDVAAELTDKMSSLYNYVYRRLVDANINHDVAGIDEAIDLLQYERETWQLLMKKLAEEEGRADADPIAGAQQTAISTYSKSA